MEINSLMVGDWIYRMDFNSPVPTKIIGMEVVNYDKMDYVVDILNNDGYSVQLYLNEIEPIPLTPEILENNEFELKSDGWLWSIDKEIEEENYIFIQFRKGCNEVRLCEINFVNKAMAKFRKINYVHQLQHALRLCGIEKEIEL